MGDLRDFDAAWAEEDDEPIVIRLLGEEWKCKRPSEVSAAFLLKLDRLMLLQASGATDLPDDFVIDDTLSSESILRTLAGDDNVDAWLARGLPYARMAQVTAYLNARYRGLDPEAMAAPNRATRRAAAKAKASPSAKS